MKIYLFTSLLFFNCCVIYAQDASTLQVDDFKNNFVVPDLPAFKVLGTDPSNLLRPSTPEELAMSLSSANDSSRIGGLFPTNYAVEFSPYQLLDNNLSLSEYAAASVFKTMRISIGTNTTNGAENLGLGFKITPVDKGDLKNDTAFQSDLVSVLAEDVEQVRALRREFRTSNDIKAEDVASSEDLQEQENKYVSEHIKDRNNKINRLIKSYEKKNWNAEKLDIAMAMLLQTNSPLESRRISFWLTYSSGLGTTWAQLMLGVNGNLIDDEILGEGLIEEDYFSANARLYGGNVRLQAYIESQLEVLEDDTTFLLNAGFELNITGSLWIDFLYGVEWNDDAEIQSDLNLKYRF
ncbi:MAG: hypothetical protein AAGA64_11145 [Bacteroidota bacterium]